MSGGTLSYSRSSVVTSTTIQFISQYNHTTTERNEHMVVDKVGWHLLLKGSLVVKTLVIPQQQQRPPLQPSL